MAAPLNSVKLGGRLRRRAPRACLPCRARKVRCDVAFHGSPCSNCTFDKRECTVPQRRRDWTPLQPATLYQGWQEHEQLSFTANAQACDQEEESSKEEPVELRVSPADAYHKSQQNPCEDLTSGKELQLEELFDMDAFFSGLGVESSEPSEELSLILNPTNERPGATPSNIQSESPDTCRGDRGADGPTVDALPDAAFSSALFNKPSHLGEAVRATRRPFNQPFRGRGQEAKEHSLVLFSCYHFVSAKFTWDLDQDDSRFLEQRGCLHLPVKPLLDDFIRQYFLHVHPILPIIHEGDFWAMYDSRPDDERWTGHLSLAVLQAMIFIACPFVSPSTIEDLGLPSARHARSKFYSVTKTLFYTDEQRDDVCSAQVALMLTYHAPTIYDRTNSFWLSTAIHFARIGGADQYQSKGAGVGCRATLKRLWRCCILRDRIMALGLRRTLQIKPTDFDFSQPGLLQEDFKDEIYASEVYDPATKRALAQLAVSLCELAVAMNGILMLCYPPGPEPETRCPDYIFQELRDSFSKLDEWHQAAAAKLQLAARLPGAHGSLTLFVNVILIYYHTAKACLNHHIVHLITSGRLGIKSLYQIWHASDEVVDSLQSITQNFIELKERNLAKYLPNTFVAFSLLPLVWQKSQLRLGGDERSQMKDRTLDGLYDVVKGFGNLYEMTDSVLQCVGIEHV